LGVVLTTPPVKSSLLGNLKKKKLIQPRFFKNFHAFFDIENRWGEWSSSRTHRFTFRERAPDTNLIGGWVGPRAILDADTEKDDAQKHLARSEIKLN
jgi:hypothetical protein